MRPLRALGIFTLVVFGGGALLAPWLYWLTQAVAPGSHLAGNPFHRFVHRSLLGLALAGIWPLLRSLGATSWRDVGLVNPRSEWRRIGAGFALGFGSLAVAAIIALASHERDLDKSLAATRVASKLLGAIGTAVIVSVLEEILFRGAIFGALRKIWDWRLALMVSSAIYAIVHFIGSAEPVGPITWISGIQVLPGMLRGFADWQMIVPGFFNLTLVGGMLALAYQRTGNLYLSMGLHAGWIFWRSAYGTLTTEAPSGNIWLFGTSKLTDGWLALLVLGVAFVVLVRLLGPPKPFQSSSSSNREDRTEDDDEDEHDNSSTQ
ncbi:MAG TPA: type II CAAX endopeptidase family protein [Verrucomicrobiae bacterium]|nr:type II CAAX endopeptidase family protein [Verrucomicrobiae bacterium]